eukprot:6361092-Amphidinium_carterae.1
MQNDSKKTQKRVFDQFSPKKPIFESFLSHLAFFGVWGALGCQGLQKACDNSLNTDGAASLFAGQARSKAVHTLHCNSPAWCCPLVGLGMRLVLA